MGLEPTGDAVRVDISLLSLLHSLRLPVTLYHSIIKPNKGLWALKWVRAGCAGCAPQLGSENP